jgi:hypothetical protein
VYVLSKLNVNLSLGKDGVFDIMLKNMSYPFIQLLVRLINKILCESTLVKSWKETCKYDTNERRLFTESQDL